MFQASCSGHLASLKRRAFEKKDATALLYLGRHCQTLESLHPIAVQCFEMSAEQGLAAAYRDLASCVYDGRGVPRDYLVAVGLFEKAAALGCRDARLFLDDLRTANSALARTVLKRTGIFLSLAVLSCVLIRRP